MPPLNVDVVIPAWDEEASLPLVLADIPEGAVREVIVVDNGSTDGTARVAREAGATVVTERRRGYGRACLSGIAFLRARPAPPDVVVFLDADHSDHPEELPSVIAPILEGRADLSIGSRVLGRREPGALLPQARAGNFVAAALIRILYGLQVTDLGPFRAIRWEALERLAMVDTNFGWTVEMQVKAAKAGLRVVEVPVSYRPRVGRSKISGTLGGASRAGYKILYTIFRHAWF
ncbi:MAG: glycosyltransferase family 2 protein [Thermoplasmata archaeon]